MTQPSTHVRISNETKHALDEIGAASGLQSTDDVINDLIAFKRDSDFWEQFDSGYSALKSDPDAWSAEQSERALWDRTLTDGLPDA